MKKYIMLPLLLLTSSVVVSMEPDLMAQLAKEIQEHYKKMQDGGSDAATRKLLLLRAQLETHGTYCPKPGGARTH